MGLENLGIIANKEKQLNKKGIYTVEDMVHFFPRKYLDCSKDTGILEEENVSCFCARVNSVKLYNAKAPMIIASCLELPSMKKVNVCWFHQNYLYSKINDTVGHVVFIAGKAVYNSEYNNYNISSPAVFTSDISSGRKIHPIYSKVPGMSDEYLKEKMSLALQHDDLMGDMLPSSIIEEEHLMWYKNAVHELHNPRSAALLEKARDRMIFDDLLYFALRMEQSDRKMSKGSQYGIKTLKMYNEAKRALPYRLTDDQEKTLSGIINHLRDGHRANALIQGDVSCGKSICAFLLMIAMADSGYQSVIMAPTQVLARQHYEELSSLVAPFGLKVAYYRGMSMKKREKKEMLEQIQSGEIKFIVGTHSVANSEIEYRNLAMTIVDEQQKFGVLARRALVEKAASGVHSITMSATPIPRTLAQTIYGAGLQLYTIKSMPSGRKPVKTFITNNQQETFDFLRREVEAGHQAYVVCPMIEQNEDMEGVKSIEEISDIYHNEFDCYEIEIGILTGKNTKEETDAIIGRFKNNEIKVLISTTVIEVGVNVPNATVVVLQNAERYGLSSAHQIRGRVGRGENQSYCILFSEHKDNERLKALVSTNDGFKIAEEDLRIRGIGNFIGVEQSGDNKYTDLMLAYPDRYVHIKQIAYDLLDSGMANDILEKNKEKITEDN